MGIDSTVAVLAAVSSTIGATLLRVSVSGRNGAGAVSVTGLEVGDILLWSFFENAGPPPTYEPPGSIFEARVTVADEIQQVFTNDLTGDNFTLILLRGV